MKASCVISYMKKEFVFKLSLSPSGSVMSNVAA